MWNKLQASAELARAVHQATTEALQLAQTKLADEVGAKEEAKEEAERVRAELKVTETELEAEMAAKRGAEVSVFITLCTADFFRQASCCATSRI